MERGSFKLLRDSNNRYSLRFITNSKTISSYITKTIVLNITEEEAEVLIENLDIQVIDT